MKKHLNISYVMCIFTVMALLVARIYLGRMLSVIYLLGTPHDDTWMLNCSYLEEHFLSQNEPWHMLLIKNIGYPILLAFVRFSGIQYTDVLAFGWFLAAISLAYLFYSVTQIQSKKILLMIFAYVLFTPIAFDTQSGLPVYRNAALAPAYFIVLDMMAILFVQHFREKPNWSVRMFGTFQILLGIAFTWTYYMKEDGIWLLLCMMSVSAACFLEDLRRKKYRSLKVGAVRVAILLLPLFMLAGVTLAYKHVNQTYFGVCEVNTRTEGEVGRFVNNVYRIRSSARTPFVWAPTDAIEKAFNASETLKKNHELKDNIMHTAWFHGNIEKNPIQGDFLAWVILSSVHDTGVCHSLAEQEDFFRKVNKELDAAFLSKWLEKDDRFQLVSSVGGRSLKEIFDLRFLMGDAYWNFITLRGYRNLQMTSRFYVLAGGGLENFSDVLTKASDTTNIDLMKENDNVELTAAITDKIFLFYSLMQPICMLFAFLGAIYGFYRILRDGDWTFNQLNLALVVSLGALLLSFFYVLAIAWFCDYIPDKETHIRFYGTGMIPMLTIFELLGMYLFAFFGKALRGRRR